MLHSISFIEEEKEYMGNTFDTHHNGRLQEGVGAKRPSKISGLYKSIQNGKSHEITGSEDLIMQTGETGESKLSLQQ